MLLLPSNGYNYVQEQQGEEQEDEQLLLQVSLASSLTTICLAVVVEYEKCDRLLRDKTLGESIIIIIICFMLLRNPEFFSLSLSVSILKCTQCSIYAYVMSLLYVLLIIHLCLFIITFHLICVLLLLLPHYLFLHIPLSLEI